MVCGAAVAAISRRSFWRLASCVSGGAWRIGICRDMKLNSLVIGRRARSLFVGFVVLALFSSVGCNRGPAIAQVSGKVLYKDGSVPKGGVRVVRFEPDKDTPAELRRAASGSIQPDGSFALCTKRPGDGVYCGKYHVTFAIMKGPREPISFIAEEYTNAASTPYHVTVDGDKSDLFFEIEPLK